MIEQLFCEMGFYVVSSCLTQNILYDFHNQIDCSAIPHSDTDNIWGILLFFIIFLSEHRTVIDFEQIVISRKGDDINRGLRSACSEFPFDFTTFLIQRRADI